MNKETIAILQQTPELNHTTFTEVCPILMYGLLSQTCMETGKVDFFDVSTPKSDGIEPKIWLYSSLAVLLISICGLGALIIIPLMQKRFYKPLIQFLVALAVGKSVLTLRDVKTNEFSFVTRYLGW